MKKFTIEEKARRFDEALAIAKDCITYVPDDAVNKYMLGIFPELKEESQEVTYYIPNGFHAEIYDDKVVIKKGEKSAEWSKEDMDIIDGIIMDYEGEIEQLSNSTIDEQAKPIYQERINFLNRLKSLRHVKQEWSEEDEEMLDGIILRCEKYGYQEQIDWLKSIKPQKINPRFPQYGNIVDKVFGAGNLETWEREEAEQLVLLAKEEVEKALRHQKQWKPSDEQMKLLREVQQALLGKDCHNRFVNFMYELKRLREE